MIRVSIAVPEALIASANQLALCIGYSEADGLTFGPPNYQDEEGALYSFASGPVDPAFVEDAVSPLKEPEWGADMAAAMAAQAAVVVWSEEAPEQVSEGKIVALIGDDVQSALSALGLVPIE